MLTVKVYSLSVFHFPMCTYALLKQTKTVKRMSEIWPESLWSKSFPQQPQEVGRFKVTDPDREASGGGRRMRLKSAVHQN